MRFLYIGLALVQLAVFEPRLQAALVRPLAIEEMARKADVIVQGTVLEKTCRRDPQGRIYTLVELRVQEVWKGNVSSNSFTIVYDGGVLGDEVQSSSVPVEYEVGEEIVAMLRLNPHGLGVTIGLVQGKFQVWADRRTGEKFARNLFHGEPKPADAPAQKNVAPLNEMPTPGRLGMADLKQKVEDAQR